MPFQPVPFAAKAAIVATLQGETIVTTMGFIQTAAWGPAELDELVSGVRDWWVANAIPHLTSAYQINLVEAKGLRGPSDFYASVNPLGIVIGALDGPPVPNNVSIAVSLRTGRIGRSNRGRIFWPSMLESEVNNNRLSIVRIGLLTAALQSGVGEGAIAANWRWTIISRYANNALRPEGVTEDITDVTIIDDVVDSQRRRLPKRGQ